MKDWESSTSKRKKSRDVGLGLVMSKGESRTSFYTPKAGGVVIELSRGVFFFFHSHEDQLRYRLIGLSAYRPPSDRSLVRSSLQTAKLRAVTNDHNNFPRLPKPSV